MCPIVKWLFPLYLLHSLVDIQGIHLPLDFGQNYKWRSGSGAEDHFEVISLSKQLNTDGHSLDLEFSAFDR